MTETTRLQSELRNLRAEVRALKEQVAQYPANPPMATDHPHIVRIEGVQGGEPIIRGAYVTVRGIVELTKQGQTPKQIVKEHEPLLSLAQVYDALSYYYDHSAEIETYIREHEEALARAAKLTRTFLRRRKRAKTALRRKKANAYARK